jgi:UDPglucose 6-dehydrogenase
MNVTVFGLGKLGSPLAVWFASAGHCVFCVDTNRQLLESLEKGIAPVDETGLQDLLNTIQLDCSTGPVEAVAASEIVFLIVPTPSDGTGFFSNRYLLSALVPVAEAISYDAHPLVVIVSTVMPGSTESVLIPFLEQESGRCCGVDFDVCYNPEFIALGSILRDMSEPSFILIGESTKKAGQALENFYRSLHETLGNPVPPFARMPIIDAEICKLSVNCFVTSKISYANQLAGLCEQIPGASANNVCAAIGLDRRINPHYLKPGTCYGGPCFPRDNVALRAFAKRIGATVPLAEATDEVNRRTTERLFDMLMERNPSTVAVLGLSYKPGTPVTEESQAMLLLGMLADTFAAVFVHDPAAVCEIPGVVQCSRVRDALEHADAVLIATAWDEYRSLDPAWFKPGAKVIDCWNILSFTPGSFPAVAVSHVGKGPASTQHPTARTTP